MSMDQGDDISTCSCPMEFGCWGAGGWHFHRFTPETIFRLERKRFVAKLGPASDREANEAWRDWLVAEEAARRFNPQTGMHKSWHHYLGVPVAYEQCGAYLAAARRAAGKAA